MIEYRDLLALAAWCRTHGMSWLPGQRDGNCESLLLEQSGPGTVSLLLIQDDQGYCLIDPSGELLVSASDLPALLDALDGGVADTVEHQVRDVDLRAAA